MWVIETQKNPSGVFVPVGPVVYTTRPQACLASSGSLGQDAGYGNFSFLDLSNINPLTDPLGWAAFNWDKVLLAGGAILLILLLRS